MHRRRKHPRHTKRLEVTFTTGEAKFRGISSDLSEGGMFIRTQNGLMPGNPIEIVVYLPGEKVCRMKGVVKRTIKTALTLMKNGMGVELINPDPEYVRYVKGFAESWMGDSNTEASSGEQRGGKVPDVQKEPFPAEAVPDEKILQKPPDSLIISCSACGAKNRVPAERLLMKPRCGKCGESLPTGDAG